MSEKPKVEKTHPHQFPAGSIVTWAKDSKAHALTRFHAPTVQVSGDTKEPVTFLGSFDGITFESVRDTDGDELRVTRPGIYKIPVELAWLHPVIRGDATVKIFI